MVEAHTECLRASLKRHPYDRDERDMGIIGSKVLPPKMRRLNEILKEQELAKQKTEGKYFIA